MAFIIFLKVLTLSCFSPVLGVFSINLVTGECVLKSLTFSGILGSHLNIASKSLCNISKFKSGLFGYESYVASGHAGHAEHD